MIGENGVSYILGKNGLYNFNLKLPEGTEYDIEMVLAEIIYECYEWGINIIFSL